MTREEFYNLTDILNSEVLGNFMHGGEADELLAMFEEAVDHSNILDVSNDLEEAAKNHAAERFRVTRDRELAEKCKWSFKAGAEWSKKHQTGKDVLDVIEKELTRRMLEDYNEGAEEDEIAQGCMASLIMFVRQMKEE